MYHYRVPNGVFEVLKAHAKLHGIAFILNVFVIHQYVFGSLLEVVHLGLPEIEIGVLLLFLLFVIFVLPVFVLSFYFTFLLRSFLMDDLGIAHLRMRINDVLCDEKLVVL